MQVNQIRPTFGKEQHNYFIAARFFAPSKRDKAIAEFDDKVKEIMGNVVYDQDKKDVGEYLRQVARKLCSEHKSTYDIFVEPLKTVTDNNGMKCECYECTAANDTRSKQVCMVFLLPVNKQVRFFE